MFYVHALKSSNEGMRVTVSLDAYVHCRWDPFNVDGLLGGVGGPAQAEGPIAVPWWKTIWTVMDTSPQGG